MASLYHLLPTLLAITSLTIASSPIQKRLNTTVGITPAMGFNNYNAGLPPSAETALNAADALISLGLKAVGYEYVNIDDGWSTMSRDGEGNLVPDPEKWPDGIEAVASEIHEMGLKFGLYGDSGTETCAGYPGSQGHEEQDAKLLASWGVDYWKYDNCATPSGDSQPRYETMRDALLATDHDILYSLCQWGQDEVWTWGAEVGHSWRVGGDITNDWESAASIAASNAGIASYAGPGGFNDFDMLEVGNGALTAAEERAHFGLWAISKSPLLIGADLATIGNASVEILSNKEIVAINQDSLGLAATTFQPPGAPEPSTDSLYPYWVGELSDGYVVGLVAVDAAESLSVEFADIEAIGAGTFAWTELYTGESGTGTGVSADLEVHDMAIFKVTAA
ncbi:hypothetical protein FQN54_009551 [Arachnomyces sp. PD_36]|nr:hypothetical protein FQN54_009551 [Arachnomyces sp. PD_36]